MKVIIVGTRGIPAHYGGFETFAEEIASRLTNKSWDVTVICQASKTGKILFGKVKLYYSKFTKDKHPVRFYFNSLKMAAAQADLILVCGVGGTIFYPLLRKKKIKIITHVDGREELREKYSAVKKLYVRLSQRFAAAYSTHIIADSHAVMKTWKEEYKVAGSKISTIGFGAELNPETDDSVLDELKLHQNEFYLVVCRMVPENNVRMIVNGFIKSGSDRKLVLVGNITDKYEKTLLRYASHKIIFLHGIYDKPKLAALRKNCFAYIHGHSVGGTNPSLLESMAAGNVCICHDNQFNRETTENGMIYFMSAIDLSNQIHLVESMDEDVKQKMSTHGKGLISSRYNWERITREYERLFNSIQSK